MARMIPPYIDKSCKSNGEKIIFRMLHDSAFTKDWIVLHSLNLSEHMVRLYGEIDFLLLIPGAGIFVMEVKGGEVKFTSGTWYFTGNKGRESEGKSPFDQGRDAMHSLKKAIIGHFGPDHKLSKLQYGYCVAFPEITFDIASPEYNILQVLDKKKLENASEEFFRELVHYFTEKHKGQSWFTEGSLPDHNDLEELCNFLRGNFERLRPIKEKLEEFNKEVITYTEQQFRMLDSIQANKQCFVSGSAGTGKTMIAMESAIRAANEGKKVLLTCFNRLIGEWMQKQLEDYKGQITVSSLHKYMAEVSAGINPDRSQENNQDFFTKYLPGLLKKIFDKEIEPKFDKLIIDEGQDLIRPEYLTLFDSMLKGGLAEGDWEIYGDFERQAIYAQLSKNEMMALIVGFSKPFNFVLTINCRNTKQIGEETSLLSGFEKPPFLLEHLEGVAVDYIFYQDETDKIQKLTAQLIKLRSGGLPMNKLVLLSPRKMEHALPVIPSGFKIIDLKTTVPRDTGIAAFATIQGYKGMESDYVILKDIEDLTGDQARSLLYVGMTRAKYGLIVMIRESAREQYNEILKTKLS